MSQPVVDHFTENYKRAKDELIKKSYTSIKETFSNSVIFFCKPSNTIITLFGVDNEKLFFDFIDLLIKYSLNSSKSFSRKFFCKLAGISSLNNSKKNSAILYLCINPN